VNAFSHPIPRVIPGATVRQTLWVFFSYIPLFSHHFQSHKAQPPWGFSSGHLTLGSSFLATFSPAHRHPYSLPLPRRAGGRNPVGISDWAARALARRAPESRAAQDWLLRVNASPCKETPGSHPQLAGSAAALERATGSNAAHLPALRAREPCAPQDDQTNVDALCALRLLMKLISACCLTTTFPLRPQRCCRRAASCLHGIKTPRATVENRDPHIVLLLPSTFPQRMMLRIGGMFLALTLPPPPTSLPIPFLLLGAPQCIADEIRIARSTPSNPSAPDSSPGLFNHGLMRARAASILCV